VLDRHARSGVKLGVERVADLLAHLGHPERSARVIHVAGTNGKGSVCTLVTEALVASGLRVGTTLSPHLVELNERFLLDGVPVDDERLERVLERVDSARSTWAAARGLGDDALTYFELSIVAAFVLFAEARVHVMVVEVGMGGRLDATNVVQPAVTAITSIGLDHMAELGPTTGAIAREKAGIVKPGVPLVVGRVDADARASIEARATEVRAPVWWLGEQIAAVGDALRTPRGTLVGVKLAMPGPHQRDNAAVALGVLHAATSSGLRVPDHAVLDGFARAALGGRIETLAPDLVVDGAHNPEGARALAAWLESRGGAERRTLVFGCGADRDPVELVAPLVPHAARVVAVTCDHPKARPAKEVAAALVGAGIAAAEGGEVVAALAAVRSPGTETLVTGSLYLIGAVKAALA
jgi:dihydrofolate synthase/folylpolyglutamate synthase